MPLVAGADCSTQATKVLVVDTDDGRIVSSGTARHEVVQVSRGASETHPVVWERALADALAQTGRAADVVALSVAAQQHGLVVVDRSGTPLRPAVLWNDTRSAGDARAIVAALGGPEATALLTGSVLSASFTVTTWAWLRRNEPEVARAARGVHLPHDHLIAALTGRACTDRSDVSGTGWWNPGSETYEHAVLSLDIVDLDPGMLAPVLGPHDVAGEVPRSRGESYGLRQGTVVGCGAGDNAAAALAMSLCPGEAALSLGTSATVYTIANLPSKDATGIVSGFASADGRFLPLACTLNATLAVDRVSEWLNLDREEVEPSGGVVCLPWLDGERTPNVPAATGTMRGLRRTTSRGAILQAAYEGVVATVLDATGALERWAPQDPTAPLLLLGGGARGPVWRETVRRLSGRPVLLPGLLEPVAYGAAVQAGAAVTGRAVGELARDWGGRKGKLLDAEPRDDAVLGEIADWRATVLASLDTPNAASGAVGGPERGPPGQLVDEEGAASVPGGAGDQ